MHATQLGTGEPELASPAPADGDYAALRPWLVRRMRSITRDDGLAEDLSQEALLRLALELRAGRAPENVRAWLARVGFNLAMSQGRRRQVAQRRSHQLLADVAHASPEAQVLERERSRSMRRVIAELAPDDRRMLVMAASGQSGLEIALAVGRSHGAVRAQLHRLRARVRGRLAALEAAGARAVA